MKQKENIEPRWFRLLFLGFLIFIGIGATISAIFLLKRGEEIYLNITIIFTLCFLFLPKLFSEEPFEFFGLSFKNFKNSISLKSLGLLFLFLIIFLAANLSLNYLTPKVAQLIREPEVSKVHHGMAIGKAIAPLSLWIALAIEFFIEVTDTFCEELLFRGLITGGLFKIKRKFLNPKFKFFSKKWAPWLIIFIQALFFGLSHWKIFQSLGAEFVPLSLFVGIYSFLFGIIAGWLFWRQKSILPAFYLHFLVNFSTVVLSKIL